MLVLDLPPGTGDVQLAVLQDLQVSGAVAVTTPSRLAVADTQKGVQMFQSLGVPTFAVVENMSYFECENGVRHFPFGRGVAATDIGFSGADVLQLPLSEVAGEANDTARPLSCYRPANASRELAAFGDLAKVVSGELMRVQFGSSVEEKGSYVVFEGHDSPFRTDSLALAVDPKRGPEYMVARFFSDEGGAQRVLRGSSLRSRDPKTGDAIVGSPFGGGDETAGSGSSGRDGVIVTKSSAKVNPSVVPSKVERKGRYGFAVQWNDGATIIYSSLSIARAAGGVAPETS